MVVPYGSANIRQPHSILSSGVLVVVSNALKTRLGHTLGVSSGVLSSLGYASSDEYDHTNAATHRRTLY